MNSSTVSTRDVGILSQSNQSTMAFAEDVPTISQGLLLLHAGHSWENKWELVNYLLVQIEASFQEILAVTFLEVKEFGAGNSVEEAVLDLLTSLSDYYQSLEQRNARLGPGGLEDLERLKCLIRSKAIA